MLLLGIVLSEGLVDSSPSIPARSCRRPHFVGRVCKARDQYIYSRLLYNFASSLLLHHVNNFVHALLGSLKPIALTSLQTITLTTLLLQLQIRHSRHERIEALHAEVW